MGLSREYLLLFKGIVFMSMTIVTYAAIHQQDLFNQSENCLKTSKNVTALSENTCPLECIFDTDCVAFGYTASTALCRVGYTLTDAAIHRTDCIDDEVIYQSTTISTPPMWTCDRAAKWEASSARKTCIKAFLVAKTWTEARADCEAVNASLITFDSQEAMDVVEVLLTTKRDDWWGNGQGTWTSAVVIDSVWRWPHDNSTWFKWNPNQPDGNGVCSQYWRRYFTLDDMGCEARREFICERDLSLHTQ